MQYGTAADGIVYTLDGRDLRRRHPHHHGRNAGILAQAVQRTEGRNALGHSVFVHYEEWLVRECRTRLRFGLLAKGRRQHDLDVVPLLHPLARKVAKEKAALWSCLSPYLRIAN